VGAEKYKLLMMPQFCRWLEEQCKKDQMQIYVRLEKIKSDGHFGKHKLLGKNIWELKWECGRRVYYSHIPEKNILLLLGGTKHGQNKDIKKAEKIYQDAKKD